MAKRGSLQEFQAHLAARLAGVAERNAAGLLGVQAGSEFWLLDLADSGEIVPLVPITGVPLTKSWFVGIANIRGNLYSVADFSAFQGRDPTPQNASSRLLLVGPRHGTNAALLCTRMLGLKSRDAMTPATPDLDAPPWAPEAYTDNEGRRWKRLDVAQLLADERFMEIGV